jgi:type VI secretion system protein ImpK
VVREEGLAMSDPSSDNGNRTVFRPSPLSGLRQGQPAPTPPAAPGPAPTPTPSAFDAPPADPGYASPSSPFAPEGAAAGAHLAQQRLNDDDIPLPSRPRETRAPLVTEAGPLLTLAASVRSGRARIAMPEFHRQASELIAAYDRAMAAIYPEETRMRARYALCATVDDIAQNLPNIGQDGAEWARRSLVVMFFRENIGGDRFWQLVDELLARPGQNSELIELFAACLAAGFEGRFRVMPDGKARLQQIIGQLYGALDHPRSQSQSELAPHWRGAAARWSRSACGTACCWPPLWRWPRCCSSTSSCACC